MKIHASVKLLFLAAILISCSNRNTNLIAKDAVLTLVSDDYKFTEGPAADSVGNVFFTDQPNNWTCNKK